ncbi:hypothetical protein OSTOST_00079 [Ostertagia ostertagi]
MNSARVRIQRRRRKGTVFTIKTSVHQHRPKFLESTGTLANDTLIAKAIKQLQKGRVLHTIASVYDPLGWIAPLMIGSHCGPSRYRWDDILLNKTKQLGNVTNINARILQRNSQTTELKKREDTRSSHSAMPI